MSTVGKVKLSDAPIEREDSSVEEEEVPVPSKKPTTASKTTPSKRNSSTKEKEKEKESMNMSTPMTRSKDPHSSTTAITTAPSSTAATVVPTAPAKRERERKTPDKFRPSKTTRPSMSSSSSSSISRHSEASNNGAWVPRSLPWVKKSQQPTAKKRKRKPTLATPPAAAGGSIESVLLPEYCALLWVDNPTIVQRMFCDGCGATGTIKDCAMCGQAFSLTDCVCGLTDSSDPNQSYDPSSFADAWKKGRLSCCFSCFHSSAPKKPVGVNQGPCHFAKQGEVSALVICLEPRHISGVWGRENHHTMAQFLRGHVPEGSFALFGFHFETEKDLAAALRSVSLLLQDPQKYLPKGTKIANDCRVLLFGYFHGRHSSAKLSLGAAVEEDDARSLYPVIQTTYTPANPECADLPEFLDIMHHSLFASSDKFKYPVQLVSLGCCNILRSINATSPIYYQTQNETTNILLKKIAEQWNTNIIIPQGSPQSFHLILESMSMARLMIIDKQLKPIKSMKQSLLVGSCEYAFFDHEKTKTSIDKCLDQFEMLLAVGKQIENRLINKQRVEKGWIVINSDLLKWLQDRCTVSKYSMCAAIRQRSGWISCHFKYDDSSTSRCFLFLSSKKPKLALSDTSAQ